MSGSDPMADLDRQMRYWNSSGAGKTFTHPIEPAWLSRLDHAARILDYGCGYGRLVADLNERGFGAVEGVDLAPALIARARRQWPALRFSVIDTPPNVAYPDASFDVILLFAVLTSVPTDTGQVELVAELRRLLRPGGLLYLSDMAIQPDERNRQWYTAFHPTYDTYGVFETDDGAVCRHHEPHWLRRLLAGFAPVADRQIAVSTMNGHPARITQLLAARTD